MIVRELTTVLKFVVDKVGVNGFNKQVLGIKKNLVGTADLVVDFVKNVVSEFRSIGDSIANIDDLSRRSGVAFESILQLQEAAKGFRIQPEQFQGAFLRFSKLVEDAKNGFGELRLIAANLNLELFDINGNFKETDKLLFDFIDALNRHESEIQRIRFLDQIFGADQGARLERFFRQGSEAIRSQASAFKDLSKEAANSRQEFEKFEKTVVEFETAIDSLKKELAITLLPPTINFFKTTNKVIKDLKRASKEGFINEESFKNLKSKLNEPEVNIKEFEEFFGTQKIVNKPIQPNISINNDINIDVPQGTTQEQISKIEDAISQAFTEQSQIMIRQLITNNPQIE